MKWKLTHAAAISAGLLVPSYSAAQDEDRTSIDVAVEGKASTNPFLLENAEEGISLSLLISPTFVLENGRNKTVLDGSVRLSQYLDNYGLDEAASLTLNSRRAVDERTDLELVVRGLTTRTGFQESLLSASEDAFDQDVSTIPDVQILDPTIAGNRSRTTSVGGSAYIEYDLDPVSLIGTGVTVDHVMYGGDIGFDNTTVEALASYGRRVSPRATIWLDGRVAGLDYADRDIGDASVFSSGVRLQHDLDSLWTLEAGVGVDFVDRNLGPAGSDTEALLSATLGICRGGLNSGFCFNGQRRAQPTAVGGVASVTSVGTTYFYNFNETERLTANARLGFTNQDSGDWLDLTRQAREVVGASLTYSRGIADNLNFFATPSYSQVFDETRDLEPNFAIAAGITLRLGRN